VTGGNRDTFAFTIIMNNCPLNTRNRNGSGGLIYETMRSLQGVAKARMHRLQRTRHSIYISIEVLTLILSDADKLFQYFLGLAELCNC